MELALAWVSLDHAPDEIERWTSDLSPEERRALAPARFEKRRRERIAGRIAARRAIAELGIAAQSYHIVEIAEGPAAGAPRVEDVSGRALDVEVSISHGADRAVAVAARGAAVGFDLERVAPRDPAFLEDAFGAGTVERIAEHTGDLDRAACLAWCVKEACMKLVKTGMRSPLASFDPIALEWREPARESTELELASLRRAHIVTRETGPLEARLLVRGDFCAALVVQES